MEEEALTREVVVKTDAKGSADGSGGSEDTEVGNEVATAKSVSIIIQRCC